MAPSEIQSIVEADDDDQRTCLICKLIQRDDKSHKNLIELWREHPDLEHNLVDALWMASSGTCGDEEADSKLATIIKDLVHQVPDRPSFTIQLQSNLPAHLLTEFASTELWNKKLKMHNTQLHYKQHKYNLAQEESEGYSKLLQELNLGRGPSRIHELIGTFELDPIRVLDVALDVLMSKVGPDKPDAGGERTRSLVDQMRTVWPSDKIESVLRFRLTDERQDHLPTVAVCVALGLIELTSFFKAHIISLESKVAESHKIFQTRERRRIQALGRVSLSGVPKQDPKLTELTDKLQVITVEIEGSEIVRVLLLLLKWNEWSKVKPACSKLVWTRLCNLFPKSVGAAICNLAVETVGSTKSTDVDDLTDELCEHMNYTFESACVSDFPELYCQICRLYCQALGGEEDDETVKLSNETYNFFKTFLVPSLSLFPADAAIATELWNVLRCLPYSTRYRMYGHWQSKEHKTLPISESEAVALKTARYVLKRLSNDNVRDMSRQLAKVANSNPMVVYSTILNQLESYDNMVDVMVEATRFVNPLGLDVLGYCILGRLSGTSGGVNRSRLKEDGVNVSQWLQSLEAFSGAFYKQSPFVEFRGMLSYLMRRLSDGQVIELGILKTLLKSPGGYSFVDYSPAESLSVTQLDGRAGSIALMQETMSFGIVDRVNVQAMQRIRQVLQKDGFGITMLILIAQVRSRVLFDVGGLGKSKSVKLIGNLYDSCQVVMTILLEFLTNSIESASRDDVIRRYAEELPTFGELQEQYGFDMASAWALCRPLVMVASAKGKGKGSGDKSRLKLFALCDSFRSTYRKSLPESVWSDLSPDLFEYFFMLKQGDLFCPENTYASEISRMEREIERHKRIGGRGKENPELERLKAVASKLAENMKSQKKHVANIRTKLDASKSSFFPNAKALRRSVVTFLSHCVIPRCLISPDDAMYCATFCLMLHKVEAVGFSTLHFIDELIASISGIIFGVTEGEAANLAILLWELWKAVNKWRYNKEEFDAELSGKLGSMMLRPSENEKDEPEVVLVDHKSFIELYDKWHLRLGTTLISSIASPEYMHTRGALVVLTRLVEVFPTQPKLGTRLLKVLAPLRDENSSRLDVKASANAYATNLLKARDDGKWVEEDAAVAQARVDKEKAETEERKKRTEKQFLELQRESEMITEEIGPRDTRRRPGGRDRGPPPGDNVRARIPSGQEPPRYREGRESGRGHRGDNYSRPPSPRDIPRGRDRDKERPPHDERTKGRNESFGQSGRSNEREGFSEQRRREGADSNRSDDRDEPRGLGKRWTRGEKSDDRRKRGRGDDGGKSDEIHASKRQRSTPPPNYDRNRRANSPPRQRGTSDRARGQK